MAGEFERVCAEAARFGWRVVLYAEGKGRGHRLTALGLRFPSRDTILLESLVHDDDLDRASAVLARTIEEARRS